MELTILVIGILIGGGVVWVLTVALRRAQDKQIRELRREKGRVEREKEEEEQIAFGFEDFNRQMGEMKQARKERILRELGEKKKVRAGEVADLFEVSEMTAFRYLEELEQEGKIRQIGKTGRSVHYELVSQTQQT